MNTKSLLFLILTTISSLTVFAQDFEVSPVALSFKLEPGEIGSKTLRITNHSSKPYDFQLELSDENYEGDKVIKNLLPGSTENSLADWLSVSPNYFKLNPNETQKIDVSLSVPSDNYETRWSTIYVKVATERSAFEADKQLGAGLLVSPRIKVSVIQSPESNTNYAAKIMSFIEGKPDKNGVRTFDVEINNIGGKVISPKLYLLSANLDNGTEKKSEPVGSSLMPSQKSTINLKLPEGLKKGKYALAVVMDYGHGSDLEIAQLMIEIE